MAACANCGNQNDPGLKFCTTCGKPLAARRRWRRRELPDGAVPHAGLRFRRLSSFASNVGSLCCRALHTRRSSPTITADSTTPNTSAAVSSSSSSAIRSAAATTSSTGGIRSVSTTAFSAGGVFCATGLDTCHAPIHRACGRAAGAQSGSIRGSACTRIWAACTRIWAAEIGCGQDRRRNHSAGGFGRGRVLRLFGMEEIQSVIPAVNCCAGTAVAAGRSERAGRAPACSVIPRPTAACSIIPRPTAVGANSRWHSGSNSGSRFRNTCRHSKRRIHRGRLERSLGELTRAAWRRFMGGLLRVRRRRPRNLGFPAVSRAPHRQHRHLPRRRRPAQLQRLPGQGRDLSSRQCRKLHLPGAQPLLWKQILRHRGTLASHKIRQHFGSAGSQ